MNINRTYIIHLFLALALPCSLFGQNWKFVKEKEGIQIYSHQEAGKNRKAFKGEAEIKAPAEKVFALLEDVYHTEWWDKNLTQIKVLAYEKNKRAQYYLVYNMPMLFKDRDLCVEVTITINQVTGESVLTAVPHAGLIPEREDLVRIKNYRQVWTVKPIDKASTRVELEFYVDPADNLPDWLLNMILVDSPVNLIKRVRQIMEKK